MLLNKGYLSLSMRSDERTTNIRHAFSQTRILGGAANRKQHRHVKAEMSGSKSRLSHNVTLLQLMQLDRLVTQTALITEIVMEEVP